MALSFRQIRYFLATADAGKLSLAAANLNVSQSAITSAIKSLEGEPEARLFERHSNGVSLTYEGHQFLQHAQNIVAAVSEATRAPRRSGSDVTGEIRAGVTYTVAGYFLPPILARFQRVFPGVSFQMHEIPREQIERGIAGGSLDIGVILVSNLQNQEDLDSEVLIRSRRRLWLCADHHLMARDAVSLAEVAEEPYVMLTVDEANHTAMRYWAPTPHRPRTIFETSSVEAVRSMVATGMGVTVLSDMVYRPWSLDGQRIEVRSVAGEVPTMDVGLAWRRGAQMSAATRAFYEYMSLTFNGSGHGFVNSGG
jgi:DNA-binding transcriptional LysR family regulator